MASPTAKGRISTINHTRSAPQGAALASSTTPPPHPAHVRKTRRDADGQSDGRHDKPPDEEGETNKDEGVIGEVEKPSPPSEKPEAP